MKKILITGGAGFIGSSLALELQERFSSSSIAVLDNLSSGNIKNLEGFKGEFIEGGVEDTHLIGSLKDKGFDAIFHEAAITDTTVDDSKKMMKVNVEGFRNILNLTDKTGARPIYASSAGVYGNGPVPMKESQELSPLNAYARSKVKDDELARAFAKRHRIIGLRYFNVYGRGEDYKGPATSMVLQLAGQMKAGKRPRIFKYGEQERDFVYVKDVVTANIKALEAEESCIVNVGTGREVSFNRIIEVLNHILGTDFEPEYFDNPYDFYQEHTQADTYLAARLIKFTPAFSIEDGIKDCYC